MKVMLLSWLFPPSTGGMETYVSNLAENLSKKFEVIVFTFGKKNKSEKINKFKVYRIKEMYPYNQSNSDLKVLGKTLKETILRENIDLIHSHNLICLPTQFSNKIIKVANNLSVPIIDHCHDARYKNLNKSLAKKNFQKIIAVSNFVRRRLIEIGVEAQKIEVIYNSSDESLFNPRKYNKKKARAHFKLPQDKKIILFPSRALRTSTGRFGRQKSFLTLLRSLKRVKKEFGKNFLLVFPSRVGLKQNKSSKERTLSLLKKRLARGGLSENVTWTNKRISLKEMPLLYIAADVMSTPSLNEAFGLVFIEAMLMGLPVIGARSGAIPEIIKDEVTGFMIKPRDSNSLAELIIRLFRNKSLSKNIGKNARRYVLSNFLYKNMITKIKKVYEGEVKKRDSVVYLVRHPETTHNKNNKLAGWQDSEYSDEGKTQFKLILDYLKNKNLKAYSSDIPRALNLARAFFEKTRSKLTITQLLRERDLNHETKKEFNSRIKRFIAENSLDNVVIFSHSLAIVRIINLLISKGVEEGKISSPRNTIFKIETVKNKKMLRKIVL